MKTFNRMTIALCVFLAVVLFAIEPVAAEDAVEVSEPTFTATVAETNADAETFLVTGNTETATETVACECTGTLADILKTINQEKTHIHRYTVVEESPDIPEVALE